MIQIYDLTSSRSTYMIRVHDAKAATSHRGENRQSHQLPIYLSINFLNPSNIVGGHKTNPNNPNTSEESKQHSRDVLNNEFNGGDVQSAADQGKNPNNV
jgi:hypothetical protein